MRTSEIYNKIGEMLITISKQPSINEPRVRVLRVVTTKFILRIVGVYRPRKNGEVFVAGGYHNFDLTIMTKDGLEILNLCPPDEINDNSKLEFKYIDFYHNDIIQFTKEDKSVEFNYGNALVNIPTKIVTGIYLDNNTNENVKLK
jgi:hypothetical protein